jgi:hypothetical protein
MQIGRASASEQDMPWETYRLLKYLMEI